MSCLRFEKLRQTESEKNLCYSWPKVKLTSEDIYFYEKNNFNMLVP